MAFYISLENFIKISLKKKALRKKRLYMFPKSGPPIEGDAHFLALLTYLSRSPIKNPHARTPSWNPSHRNDPFLKPFFHFSNFPYMSPIPDSRFPLDVKRPLWKVMAVSGAFFNVCSILPNEGTPPPLRHLPRSFFRERRSIPSDPFIHLSKSTVDEPSSKFPKCERYGKKWPSPEPFLHILRGPQQGNPPSRFPSQSSHRQRRSTSREPFNHISKSLVFEPNPYCQAEPPWRQMPVSRVFLS